MATTKPVNERKARAALIDAAERARMATGSAQWTNGYRTRAEGNGLPREETDRLYHKEMDQWKRVTETEARFTRAIAAYRRAILAASRTS